MVTDTMLRGTAAEVDRETRYAVEVGVRVVRPERAVPFRTPIENLQAIRRAVEPIG